ncbi:MAG: hypothetical protein AAGI92_04705 [Pseudomonadota bacterium]
MSETDLIELSDQQKKARRQRSIALAICLALFVVVFYAVTVVKLGPEIMSRSI